MSSQTRMAAVQDLLGQPRLALYGLSHAPQHFSHAVLGELRARGHEVVAINPAHAGEEVDGLRLWGSLAQAGQAVDWALVMTPADHAAAAVRDALDCGLRRIWLYRGAGRGAVSDEALALCAQAGATVVPGECPLMFLRDTQWFHRLHGWLQKVGGNAPRGEAPDGCGAPTPPGP